MTVRFHSPKALGASKAGVENFAENFAENIGFGVGHSIEELIYRLGGRIIVGTSGFGDEESGSIVARDTNDFEIFVSKHTSLKRDRFTMAHELGHLFLHFGKIKAADATAVMRATRYVDESDADQQRAEWEANWFAAAFLMPSKKFAEEFARGGLEAASDACAVSATAASIRAKNLGLS